jgi:hypothetical protein
VRAWHAEVGATGEEESEGAEVIKLAVIVALNSLNGGAELRVYMCKNVRESSKSVRLEA